MSNIAIKAENITKQYRLGAIGGGTLKGDIQSLIARMKHEEDPNSKIGTSIEQYNQKFLALDDVSFKITQGDIVGIIGHNGAGKSTLLKLLSRVTAPTSGTISMNGRIASMLEVGTGFHPELTGRENVYMNGAILGMTKAEITKKFDEIVEFAEMGKFIDTPVKRYSSGMYVKLAFAVAAHLDSEILVMDEVLAVGDMKFQEKCLGKMGDVSAKDGRTVLYVSHNMSTIRTLCKHCMVLDHGKKIFEGGVNEAIDLYADCDTEMKPKVVFSKGQTKEFYTRSVKMISTSMNNTTDCIYKNGDIIDCTLNCVADFDTSNARLRVELINGSGNVFSVSFTDILPDFKKGNSYDIKFDIDTSNLLNGKYTLQYVLYQSNDFGNENTIDLISNAIRFVIQSDFNADYIDWFPQNGGAAKLNNVTIKGFNEI